MNKACSIHELKKAMKIFFYIELYSCKNHCIKLWLQVWVLVKQHRNGIAIPGELTKNRRKGFSAQGIDHFLPLDCRTLTY